MKDSCWCSTLAFMSMDCHYKCTIEWSLILIHNANVIKSELCHWEWFSFAPVTSGKNISQYGNLNRTEVFLLFYHENLWNPYVVTHIFQDQSAFVLLPRCRWQDHWNLVPQEGAQPTSYNSLFLSSHSSSVLINSFDGTHFWWLILTPIWILQSFWGPDSSFSGHLTGMSHIWYFFWLPVIILSSSTFQGRKYL